MEINKINIVISSDDNYSKYAGVVICSILKNAAPSDFCNIHILDGGISLENKRKILSLGFRGRFKINFIPVDEKCFSDYQKIPTHDYLSLASFFRLKLAAILHDISKVIYLDCDTLVLSSLSDLYNCDIEQCAVAGVQDIDKRKVKNNRSYINSGVMLMNLEFIRRNKIEDEFLSYAISNCASIKLGDQEIINEVLKGRIKLLDPEWNVQVSNFVNRSSYTRKPKIIHYLSKQKPWNFGSWNWFKRDWKSVYYLTPWASAHEQKKSYIMRDRLSALIGFIKYRPLTLFRPRFYKAFYFTFLYGGNRTEKVFKNENTFFLWEPCSKSHAEVVPGYAKYLIDLGYEVSVFVANRNLREGLFDRFNSQHLHINNLSRRSARSYLKRGGVDSSRGILVTTVGKLSDKTDYKAAYDFFKYCKSPSKILFVEHEVAHSIDSGNWNEKLITLRKIDYKGKSSVVVNPHFFGNVRITDKNKNITKFIIVGAIHSKKRNNFLIMDSARALIKSGIKNFKITIVGKGKIYVPHDLRDNIELMGPLSFSEMYKCMEEADFLLTSYQEDDPRHIRYITTGTSGAFQLVYGFLTPIVIHEKFAKINGFDSGNSVIYPGDEQYAEALKRCIEMSPEEYKLKQDKLGEYVNQLYATSLRNLKRLIDE